MTTPTAKLALAKPTSADPFLASGIAANLDKIDAHAGSFICTSGSRPTWGAAHDGMTIFETDSDLEWRWDGSAFERTSGSGVLFEGSSTSDVTSVGPSTSLFSESVVIPAGSRPVYAELSWSLVTGDPIEITIEQASSVIRATTALADTGGFLKVKLTDVPTGGAQVIDVEFSTTATSSTVAPMTNGATTLEIVEY